MSRDLPLERHTLIELGKLEELATATASLVRHVETLLRHRATPLLANAVAAARSLLLDTVDAARRGWALVALVARESPTGRVLAWCARARLHQVEEDVSTWRGFLVGADDALRATPTLPIEGTDDPEDLLLGGHPDPEGHGLPGPVSRPSLTLYSSSSAGSGARDVRTREGGSTPSAGIFHRTPDGNTGGPPAPAGASETLFLVVSSEEKLELEDLAAGRGDDLSALTTSSQAAEGGPAARTAAPPFLGEPLADVGVPHVW